MMRISRLIGTQVTDQEGRQIGSIEDVWLTSGGEISHLTVRVRRQVGDLQPGTYFVPADAVSRQGENLQLQQTENLTRVEGGGRPAQVAQSSIRGSALMQYRLIDQGGEEIGSIEDIVVDLEQGTIAYTAVSLSGGQLGAQQQYIAIPYDDIWYNLSQQTVTLNVTRQEVEQAGTAAGFSPDSWPSEANRQWKQQIEE